MPHVFISYVSEDRVAVAHLCDSLRLYDIEVWLDKDQLKPGQRWADAIRSAISEGAFFIACFSRAYNERLKTYMNEELTLAIDELRQRSTNQAWFIPVLLDECEVPNRSIGGGETLQSLQWVNLYENRNDGIGRILSTVNPHSARVHQLISALKDNSARVRIQAADALGKLGSLAQLAVSALVQALEDSNSTVRAAAADALGKFGNGSIGEEETVLGLQKVLRAGEFYSSQHAAVALTRFGARGVPALLEATSYKSYGVASHAADALALISDKAAVPMLVEAMLSAIHSGHDCRMMMRDTIGIHTGPHLASNIAVALGNIGDQSGVAALVIAQSSACSMTRKKAIEALEKIGVNLSGQQVEGA
jgi:hypothetical protein